MGGNFCQILQLGGTTIKGRRVLCLHFVLKQADSGFLMFI